MILLLRGAPGVGKSTAAALAVLQLGGAPRAAVVEVDDLRGDLWHVSAVEGMPDHARHLLAVAQAAGVALALLGAGVGLVIVVDTFSRAGVDAFTRALRRRAGLRTVTLTVGRTEHCERLCATADRHTVTL